MHQKSKKYMIKKSTKKILFYSFLLKRFVQIKKKSREYINQKVGEQEDEVPIRDKDGNVKHLRSWKGGERGIITWQTLWIIMQTYCFDYCSPCRLHHIGIEFLLDHGHVNVVRILTHRFFPFIASKSITTSSRCTAAILKTLISNP